MPGPSMDGLPITQIITAALDAGPGAVVSKTVLDHESGCRISVEQTLRLGTYRIVVHSAAQLGRMIGLGEWSGGAVEWRIKDGRSTAAEAF